MTANSIGGRTGLIGIIGHPVRHTLSPRMQNAALEHQGIDLVYLAFDVVPERLPAALAGVRALGLHGVNITIPHKQAVVGLLDEVDETVLRIGSVNTVVNDDGRLVGHNTDKSGFAAALRSLRPGGAAGLTCFVAGAGGAARSVVAALIDDRAGEIRVFNRTPERAAALCAEAAAWGGAVCLPVNPAEAASAAEHSDLLVNATSVGLISVKESAIPVDILHSRHLVMDLVYSTSPTRLVREAKVRGATAIDGKEMLLMQAAGSYELWTGRSAPLDVMRASIAEKR